MIGAKDIRKRHGSLEVLRGITLEVKRGEVAAIIGPSGGGKSTFLRCLNGLETFDQGEVTIDDVRFDATTPAKPRERQIRAVCRRVGMVFQQFHLFPHRSVLQNVTEAPIHVLHMPRDRAEEKARALLDRVGLAKLEHKRPGSLSGGQQQRVAIARALAMEPKAILFDEPTSALDPRMTGEVLAVIADLAREGQTMLVVTHAMGFARQVAGTVHVFADGLVVESGPAAMVIDDPQAEATKRLLTQARAS